MIKREVVCKATDHVRRHISGVYLLNTLAELFLYDALSKPSVVAHHINLFLLICNFLSYLCSTLDGSFLTSRLLVNISIVFCKYVANIYSLVNQGCLHKLKGKVNLMNLSVLVPTEQFAHEKYQVEVFGLIVERIRIIYSIRVLEPLRHDIKEEFETVSGHLDSSPVKRVNKLIAVEITVSTTVSCSERLLEGDPLCWECNGSDLL